MSNLVRWNPLRDMMAMQSMMDRMLEDTLRPMMDTSAPAMSMALDIDEDDRAYHLQAELPGVNPENINIRMQDDTLIIEAHVHSERTAPAGGAEQGQQVQGGKRALVRERRTGRFVRAVRLPQAVNAEQVEADYRDGVLHLTLPKVEARQPRQIPIRTGAGSQGAPQLNTQASPSGDARQN